MDDEKIIELYWQRDEQAIKETDCKYRSYCMTISKNILSDLSDSEENVSDTYMQMWNSIPPHRPRMFTAFLGRITRNLALNKLKARHAKKRMAGEFALSLNELDACVPSNISVDDELRIAELSKCLSRFLYSQSAQSRNVFICRYFYCYSISDISELFGYGQSKVKSILMRTRARLKLHLEKEGILDAE